MIRRLRSRKRRMSDFRCITVVVVGIIILVVVVVAAAAVVVLLLLLGSVLLLRLKAREKESTGRLNE